MYALPSGPTEHPRRVLCVALLLHNGSPGSGLLQRMARRCRTAGTTVRRVVCGLYGPGPSGRVGRVRAIPQEPEVMSADGLVSRREASPASRLGRGTP